LAKTANTHSGYLAIIVAGLLLCVGLKYETNRQYQVAWQHHLETQQNKARNYSKRVNTFFTALNDNLATLSTLPAIRNLKYAGQVLTPQDRETVQQVFNNLAKNVDVSKAYVVPAGIDPLTAKPMEPVLTLDRVIFPASTLLEMAEPPPKAFPGNREYENQQLQQNLTWFKQNYPNISALRKYGMPMISGPEILTSYTRNSIRPNVTSDKLGLIFSVPYYGANGEMAGTVSAVVLSNILRSVADNQSYTLISPLAEFVSALPKRNANVKMMMHANDATPDESTIFSDSIVIDTHDARGKWQLQIEYPVADFYKSTQFMAIRYFEYGAYGSLVLLTLVGLGWHHSILKRAEEMRKSAAALQIVNDDISKLNLELAGNMKELRAAQDEIIKKGKLAQMGQLVATVAHELRNPLSSVRTSAFLLRRKLEGVAINVEAQLQRIDNSVARCDGVITQFLDYAKTQKMELGEHHFDNWVAKVVEEEAQKLPLAVAVECVLGLDDLKVPFDPSRLGRALINLMSNASEAMVGMGNDPAKFACADPKITIATRLSGDRVEIDISDNGPGIADENVGKILEPLFTTKSFGTGLGLPAVTQVLEQHGGGMKINGGFGTGATFTAWLPLKAQQEQAA
jgi:signal transduction histidine kinase